MGLISLNHYYFYQPNNFSLQVTLSACALTLIQMQLITLYNVIVRIIFMIKCACYVYIKYLYVRKWLYTPMLVYTLVYFYIHNWSFNNLLDNLYPIHLQFKLYISHLFIYYDGIIYYTMSDITFPPFPPIMAYLIYNQLPSRRTHLLILSIFFGIA